MSTTQLNVSLPESVSAEDAKVMLAVKLFEAGKATLGQAAKVAGYSKRAFLEVLGHCGVPVADYPPEELQQELAP